MGLTGECGGGLISLINWFLDATPTFVQATGGIYSYRDGRDVNDHVYATLEYPKGKTAMLSLIQSNGFEGSYVQFMGTKATLIIGQGESLLFLEDQEGPTTVGTATVGGSQPVINASASRRAESASHSRLAHGAGVGQTSNLEAFQYEIAGFCGAIRTGAPLRCSPSHAHNVTLTCLAVNEAIERRTRINPQKLVETAQPSRLDVGRREIAHA